MVLRPYQGHKGTTALDKRSPDVGRAAVISERECFQEIDAFCSSELLDGDFDSRFPKHLPVVVEVASLQAEVLGTIRPDLSFSMIASDAHRLFCPWASGVYL